MKSYLPLFIVLLQCQPSATSLNSADKNPIIIAHRGDHSVAPENTLKAFEDAINNGAGYVEVDLRTTADGHLVVMHDKSVDRTTNGKGNVSDITLIDILSLKVIDPKELRNDYKVPTFEDVLALGKNKIGIYLDFKEASVSDTWEFICQYGMQKSVAVYLNREEHYHEWRRVAPGVPLIASLPDSVRDVQALKAFLQAMDVEILDGNCSDYTKEMVSLANQMGRRVWVDVQSIDEGTSIWQRALDLGVQGMQTDHLPELKGWLKGGVKTN